MVEYLKTKKGYFLQIKKNGEKKRISQEEYIKKNKTRKNKKMIGGAGEPIEQSDIMYIPVEREQRELVVFSEAYAF